ncbi:hypothetical protein AMTRI_Chr12g240100 [Amborella trichopoda]
MERLAVGCIAFAVLVMVVGGLGEEEWGVVRVGGKVLCQDCTQGWNEWVHGAKPIKGSKVAVTCMDERKRTVYYASDETDEQGEFEIPLKKEYVKGKSLSTVGCLVRLVSSPDPLCNVPTDFGRGHSGVTLEWPSIVYKDLIKHIVGPFYFTSSMCEEPDTQEEHDQGTNY